MVRRTKKLFKIKSVFLKIKTISQRVSSFERPVKRLHIVQR